MGTNNFDIFSKKLKDHAQKRVVPEIASGLSRVADRIVFNIETGAVPEQTTNLMNSTGVGVYNNGTLAKYAPVQTAEVSRPGKEIYGTDAENRDYWGSNELDDALMAASTTYSSGVWIVLFSTMPYAEIQEEEKGYFSRLVGSVLKETDTQFNQLKIDMV